MRKLKISKDLEKKGFTLVELSAVIIILAIIALIAVPTIGNVIEKFKEDALKNSAYGLVEASNVYYTKTLNNEMTEPVMFDFVDNNQTSEAKLAFKGKINNGKVILNTDGKVVLCISDGKYYAYKELIEDKVTTGKGSCSYDGQTGNFNIISDVDTLNQQIKDLQAELVSTQNTLNGQIDTLQTEISNAKASIAGALTNKGVSVSTTAGFDVLAQKINDMSIGYKINTLYNIYQYSALYSSGTIAILDVSKYSRVKIDSITFSQSNNMKVAVYIDDVLYTTYGATVNNLVFDVSSNSKIEFKLLQGTTSSEAITITGVEVS